MLLYLLSIPLNIIGSIWGLVIISLLIVLYFHMKKQNEYFPKNGIKTLPTYIPFVGHFFKVIIQTEHFLTFLKNMYKIFPDDKYFGLQHFTQPVVVLKDVELIKQIAIKDFDHFVDHVAQVDESIDPLFGNNLVALTGQKWRDMRATLSPAFTSSKMRAMFDFVSDCGDQMSKYFLKEADKSENREKNHIEIDLKDTFTRYTNDVIASSAFGITVNSLEDRENEFFVMGKTSTQFSLLQLFKLIAMFVIPRVMKFFKIPVLNPKVSKFFRDIVNDSMKMREEQGIVRPDMIHLLMEAKKGSLKYDTVGTGDKDAGFATVEESDMGKRTIKRVWSDDDIVAQAVIFFLAGFDTSSTLLSFLAYELAKNPDIQTKLQAEIDEIAAKNNCKVKYDDLQHMKYMDMVVSETLRYWPPAVMTDRKCLKPYTLPPSNNRDQTGGKLYVGDGVWFPIYSVHHDSQYFKDPEKFDPERFSEENKHEINPLAYMPFGVGPRNCIGSRFALMEVKSVVFYLLRNFNLVVTSKTLIPFELSKVSFNMMPKGGFWLGLSRRVRK